MHVSATHVILPYVAYVPRTRILRTGDHAGARAVIANAAFDLYHTGRAGTAGAAAAHVGVRAVDATPGCTLALLAGAGAAQRDVGRADTWPSRRTADTTSQHPHHYLSDRRIGLG